MLNLGYTVAARLLRALKSGSALRSEYLSEFVGFTLSHLSDGVDLRGWHPLRRVLSLRLP